jgi:hypothetical protein
LDAAGQAIELEVDHSFDHKYGGFAGIFGDNAGQKQANAGWSDLGRFEHEHGRSRALWTALDILSRIGLFRVRVSSSAQIHLVPYRPNWNFRVARHPGSPGGVS